MPTSLSGVAPADALTLAARSAASEQSGASYTIAKQRFDVGGISEYSAASTRIASTALVGARARGHVFRRSREKLPTPSATNVRKCPENAGIPLESTSGNHRIRSLASPCNDI